MLPWGTNCFLIRRRQWAAGRGCFKVDATDGCFFSRLNEKNEKIARPRAYLRPLRLFSQLDALLALVGMGAALFMKLAVKRRFSAGGAKKPSLQNMVRYPMGSGRAFSGRRRAYHYLLLYRIKQVSMPPSGWRGFLIPSSSSTGLKREAYCAKKAIWIE